MVTERSEHVIEVRVDDSRARATVDRLTRQMERLNSLADNVMGGGGGPGGGGGRPPRSPRGRQPLPAGPMFNPAMSTGAGLIGAAGSMAGNFGAGAMRVGGTLATGAMGALSQGIGHAAKPGSALAAIGAGVGSLVPIVGGAFTFMGQAAQMRMETVRRAAAIQRQRAFARLSGVSGSLKDAAKFGFMPEEAAGALRQAGQVSGFRRGGISGLFRMMAAGGSVGAIAGLRGVEAPGVGGVNGGAGSPATFFAQAFSMGLRGARLDQFLQMIAQGVESLGQQGLDVNMKGLANFTGRMATTMPGQGARIPRVAMGLANAVGGARQQLLSPFAQLPQIAVLMQALRSGGGIMGALQEMERMSAGPGGGAGATLGAMQQMFGGQMGTFGLMNLGLGTGAAGQMMQGLSRSRRFGLGRVSTAGGALQTAMAKAQAARISGVLAKPTGPLKMIQTSEQLRTAMESLGSQLEKVATQFQKLQTNLSKHIAKGGSMESFLKKEFANIIKKLSPVSDREMKNIHSEVVDTELILAAVSTDLALYEWDYKADETGQPHMGPTAQDFLAVTGLGDGKHIFPLDAQGVIFACIKALVARVDELSEQLKRE